MKRFADFWEEEKAKLKYKKEYEKELKENEDSSTE